MTDARSLRRLWTSIRASVRGLRATPLVFAASVGTMAAGLLLLGAYLLIVQNMHRVLERFGSELRITVYLESELIADSARLEALAQELRASEGVARAIYVSPERALERLRRELGAEAGILDGLNRNPLPGSFELEVDPATRGPAHVRALARQLEGWSGVSEVRYGESWLESYARVVNAVEWLGVVLGGFLLLVLGAIVAGTVRLAVHARSDEIQIQRLVGAGGLFVRLPFYLEGALQGALAALLALGLLYAAFSLGLPVLKAPLAFLLGRMEPSFFGAAQAGFLMAVGVGLGLGGALVSLIRLEDSP